MRPISALLVLSITPLLACSGGGSATMSVAADAGPVVADSAPRSYTVGGTVVGLTGTGLVLLVGGQSVSATRSGGGPVPFQFPAPLVAGSSYAVTVQAQPTSPAQTCTVMAGSGTVAHADVSGIVVNCSTDTFVVGGTVTGIEGAGLVLTDNGGDALTINGDGSFAFATPIASGGAYAVAVGANPSFPAETCTVSGATGAIASANVTAVEVSCVPNAYKVGGTVAGLTGTGLVLTDNGSDDLDVMASGPFVFASQVTSGSPFDVTITTQPSGQECTISANAGTVGAMDALGIVVNCSANTFTVGGTVTGLVGQGLALGGTAGSVAVGSDGAFTFPVPLAGGAQYDVQIATEPTNPAQTCTVSGGGGTVAGVDVTSVQVTCATGSFTLGGTASGLAPGDTLTLANGSDSIQVTSSGFTFDVPVGDGQAYSVQVAGVSGPVVQGCVVTSGGSGNVSGASVTDVLVTCTSEYTIGGTLAGLTVGESIVVLDPSGNPVPLTQNGPFTLPNPLGPGAPYSVTIQSQPSSPVVQTCILSNGSGTVGSAPVTSIAVDCDMLAYFPFSGDAHDASGYGNDGVVTSAALTTGHTGDANGAYAFSGSGSIEVVPPQGFWPGGDASRTLTAWLQPTQSTGEWGVVYWGTGNCTGLQFGIGDQGQQATFWGGCDDDVTGLAIPVSTPGSPAWTFVAITYSQADPTSFTMYVDGTSLAGGIGSPLATDPSSDLVMGADLINGAYFNGNLDSVRVYGHALSASEIESIYTSAAP